MTVKRYYVEFSSGIFVLRSPEPKKVVIRKCLSVCMLLLSGPILLARCVPVNTRSILGHNRRTRSYIDLFSKQPLFAKTLLFALSVSEIVPQKTGWGHPPPSLSFLKHNLKIIEVILHTTTSQ